MINFLEFETIAKQSNPSLPQMKQDVWGNSYGPKVHEHIMSVKITSHPAYLHAIAVQNEKNKIAALSVQSRHPSRSAVQAARVESWCNVMEFLLLKQQLCHAVTETDILLMVRSVGVGRGQWIGKDGTL